MNKRCTNSSCRRTFSTLNFDGFCPWCGKAYPQLAPPNSKGSCRKFIKLRVTDRKGSWSLRIDLTEVLALIRAGKLLDSVKRFRDELLARGLRPDLRSAMNFCKALRDGKQPCADWHKTGEIIDGLPVLKARNVG